VGEELGAELGAGRYRLEAVAPGSHRLLVYAGIGDVYDSAFATDVAFASAELEVLIDLCVETQVTRVRGTVRDARGKAVKDAAVVVYDLFLDTATDARGRYELELPPGTWEVAARRGGGSEDEASASITLAAPEEPDAAVPVVDLDIELK
jgi:hypothetical protein